MIPSRSIFLPLDIPADKWDSYFESRAVLVRALHGRIPPNICMALPVRKGEHDGDRRNLRFPINRSLKHASQASFPPYKRGPCMNFDFDAVYLSGNEVGTAIPSSGYSSSSYSKASFLTRGQSCEGRMHITRGPTPGFNRGEPSENWRKVSPSECHDWLADQLRDKSAKVIARSAGTGPRAAESVKQGRNGMDNGTSGFHVPV